MTFKQLKANLQKDFSGLPEVKVAILADSAIQLLSQAVRGAGHEAGLDLRIFEADSEHIEHEVLNPATSLYAFEPDFVCLFHSAQKLSRAFYALPPDARHDFSDAHLARIRILWDTLGRNRVRGVIQFNLAEIQDGTFGHYANKMRESFLYHLRRINFELMNMARLAGNVFINDVSVLHARAGANMAFSPQLYVDADMVFSLDFLPDVAKGAVDIVSAALGRAKKCLILDLDNTLWGGSIGDDGLDHLELGDLGVGKAFTELQAWAKRLKERGVILAVCSKNDEAIAREPFEKHPDMLLGLSDITVFAANWEDKPDNIRRIQQALNIGFDAMVFLDDSPFEREMVRRALPAVTVPELPEDPAEFVPFLCAQNLFEMATYSEEDINRTRMYREEAHRRDLEVTFSSKDEFLASLDMSAVVSEFTPFLAPRVAQLTQRSNQFNLRTVRYTEKDIERIAASRDHRTLAFSLADRFGDYGLISAVILERVRDAFFIDTWIMSCRVLKRGVEQLALEHMVASARKSGAASLIGEYVPTAKNGLVKAHYAVLGFRDIGGGRWELRIEDYKGTATFIRTTS